MVEVDGMAHCVKSSGEVQEDKETELYIFGGVNEEEEFNDIRVMKLINPSDRQPIMKEILSEFGIHEVSNRFSPTKIPKVRYELTELLSSARTDSPPQVPASEPRDLSSIHKQAVEMITRAFAMLDIEFQNLNTEKTELNQARIAFQKEKDAYDKQYRSQQQELQEMLEKHKARMKLGLKLELRKTTEKDKSSADKRQSCCRNKGSCMKNRKTCRNGASSSSPSCSSLRACEELLLDPEIEIELKLPDKVEFFPLAKSGSPFLFSK
ncbi:uncharacterized protein zmp:0000001301 [Callorhinchus milii]|uniref:uncharacterized protein zmp:0000001301 n=1 Tax=Callorhinchus milii TaxID=7868 RepID=UPI001C3FAB52|nr:uncharacterized protein zmp:0000001301 [Callorhinchus milii]